MDRLLLRKIQLRGFKSYGEEKIVEGFNENLTCICGPNGSGKSSLVEALAFVLQSRVPKKHLQCLQNDTRGSQQSVSVTLYFEKQKEDGSLFLLIQKEVQNGKCRCYVNQNLESWEGPKKIVQMNEAIKFLKEYGGLDVEFPERFIIFQMRTIEVAGKTPQKLLHFLEKIIGTSQLHKRIETQKENLSELRISCTKTEEDISRFEKKREILKPKVLQFERYAQEKERYSMALLDFLKEKTFYNLIRITEASSKANELAKRKLELLSILKKKKKKHLSLEKKTKQSEKALAECVLDEKNATKALQKAKLAQGRLQSQETYLQNANQHLQNQFETLQKKVKESNEQISNHTSELETLRSQGETFPTLTPEQTKKIVAFQKKHAVSRNNLQTAEQELSSLQAEYSSISDDFEKKNASLLAQKTVVQKQLQENKIEQANLDCSSKSLELEIEKLQRDRLKAQQREDDAQATQSKYQHGLQTAKRSLENLMLASATTAAETAVNFLRSRRKDVYGFLCNLAIVPGPARLAVNQVLFPVLQKVVVVENRAAANAVINYFKQQRIGVVQCEILSELKSHSPTRAPSDNLTSLFDALHFSDQKFGKVFWKFTHSWWLAESCESALSLSFDSRDGHVSRRNVVSLGGTVAYSWGSVLKNLSRIDKISSLAIKDCFPTPLPPTTVPSSQDHSRQKLSELEKNVCDCNTSLQSIEQEIKKLMEETQNIDQKIEEIAVQSSELDQKSRRIASDQSTLETKIEMTDSEIENLSKSHKKRKADIDDRICGAQSRFDEIKHKHDQTETKGRTELGEEALEVYRVQQSVRDLEEQLKKEELVVSMTSKSMSSLEGEISKKQDEIENITMELKVHLSLTKNLKKKREECKNSSKGAIDKRDQLQEKLSSREDEMHDLKTKISTLRKEGGKVDVELEDLRFSVMTSASLYKSEMKNRNDSPPSPAPDDSSDEEMPLDEEMSPLSPNQDSSLPLRPDVLAPGLEDEYERWKGKYEKDRKSAVKSLEDSSEEMKHKRLRLVALKEEVDLPALTEDSKLSENISACTNAVEKTKLDIQAVSSKITSLETERFERFSKAIASLNESLSSTYHHLNPYGDCSLHYNPLRELIFDGVWLKVRPDRVWKDFHSLSGGQKALAALALSLAFQQQYPSPLYVFDEVDASLDIVAVERLAKFIIRHSMQTSSQFLVVSLRPEFFQWAPVLVGTHFTSSGVSNVVTFRPRKNDEDGEEWWR